jgi:hypothetical protein
MNIAARGLDCRLNFGKADNEDWMWTSVKVRAPAFEGEFNCTIQLGEWGAFIEILRELQTCVGSDVKRTWANMEGNVELEFTLTKHGAIEGAYRFSPENTSLGPVLYGSFEADQTFLPKWLRDAEEVLENAR